MDQLKAYSSSITARKDINPLSHLIHGNHSNYRFLQSGTALESGALERCLVLLTFASLLMGFLLLGNMQLKRREPGSTLEKRALPPKTPYAFTIRSHLVFLFSGAAGWAILFS